MFNQWNSQQVYLMAGAGIILIYLFLRTLRSRKAEPVKFKSTKIMEEPRTTEEEPKDLMRWQVEMYELGRDLKGEITCQMSALQTLILAAKEEQSKLENLLTQLQNERSKNSQRQAE